jgi:hypothetical protein
MGNQLQHSGGRRSSVRPLTADRVSGPDGPGSQFPPDLVRLAGLRDHVCGSG